MKDVVIIPTYNERENIEVLIPEIFAISPDVFVTVVDDNSPDRTADVVKEFIKKYPNLKLLEREKKEGLGKAYIHAFRKTLEDKHVRSVIMMDADLSHSPSVIPHMRKHSADFSVVVGSRYIKGGKIIGWELWRRVLSLFGNFYCRSITRLPINECTGGFNLISADLLRSLDFDSMDSSGYAFIMELKFMLNKAGGKFKETPIIFKNRVGGESKISNHIIKEGILAPWKMILKK